MSATHLAEVLLLIGGSIEARRKAREPGDLRGRHGVTAFEVVSKVLASRVVNEGGRGPGRVRSERHDDQRALRSVRFKEGRRERLRWRWEKGERGEEMMPTTATTFSFKTRSSWRQEDTGIWQGQKGIAQGSKEWEASLRLESLGAWDVRTWGDVYVVMRSAMKQLRTLDTHVLNEAVAGLYRGQCLVGRCNRHRDSRVAKGSSEGGEDGWGTEKL